MTIIECLFVFACIVGFVVVALGLEHLLFERRQPPSPVRPGPPPAHAPSWPPVDLALVVRLPEAREQRATRARHRRPGGPR